MASGNITRTNSQSPRRRQKPARRFQHRLSEAHPTHVLQPSVARGRPALLLERLEDVPAPLPVDGVLRFAPQVEERLYCLWPPNVVGVPHLEIPPLVEEVVLAAQLAGLALVELVTGGANLRRQPDLSA
jgi:hypothetical protein